MEAPPGSAASRRVRVVPREEHSISRRDIDPDALKVLYRLYRNHHAAYLVGGGVRDLLLGRKPKDFDVGTDATPERIRQLFRNSRIIGRRFPLVHVYFRGGKIVEVSTFRRNAPNSDDGTPVRRDDTWGSPEEDAWRRDLTINGLFYDIGSFAVIDFVGGLEDLEGRVIRTIGDPFVRLREDPVRMIRAIRHAARTGFRIEERTYRATCELAELIGNCAPARVLEEFLRELRGGASAASIRLMRETGVLRTLAPILDDHLSGVSGNGEATRRFWAHLETLDAVAAREEEAPSNAVALSVVLSDPVLDQVVRIDENRRGGPDVGKLVREALMTPLRDLAVSRRDAEKCFHVLLAGRRLRRAVSEGRIPSSLRRKSYFPDAWAYFRLLLRSEGWEAEDIDALLERPDGGRRRSRRRRRGRRRRRPEA